MDNSAEYWKKKYEETEGNLQKLKDLAHKGVLDYEQLKKKYDQNYKQYEDVKVQLEKAQEHLKSFNIYAEKAVEEYGELERELQLQNELRDEVTKYAAKVTQDKKKFQRQSCALLDRFKEHLTVADMKDLTEEDDEVNGETETAFSTGLQNKIGVLNTKVATLEARLSHSEEARQEAESSLSKFRMRYEQERERCLALEASVKEHQLSLETVEQVSLLAIEEHEELKKKYELERSLKEQLVKEAQKLEQQRKVIARQSQAAIGQASADLRVKEAFSKMEEMSEEIAEIRGQLELKEKELAEVQNSDEISRVNRLENQLQQVLDDNKRLEDQVKSATRWNEKLTNDYKKIEQDLQVAKEKLLPPPPPPPPPPPAVLKPLYKMLKYDPVKKARIHGLAKDKPPEFAKALEELMTRIKRGDPLLTNSLLRSRTVPLRSHGEIPFPRQDATQRESGVVFSESGNNHQSENVTGMNEMKNMLKKMRRSHSECERPTDTPNSNSEFCGPLAEAFKRVRGAPPQKSIDETEEVFPV